MTPEEVLRQLEKHEASCDKRYEQIQATLEKLDNSIKKSIMGGGLLLLLYYL
jgi:hypothetical protein